MPYNCHKCQTLLAAGTTHCPGCGIVFPKPVPADVAPVTAKAAVLSPNGRPDQLHQDFRLTRKASETGNATALSPSTLQQQQSNTSVDMNASPCFKLYGNKIVGLDRLLAPGEKIICISGGMMKTHMAGADTARAAACAATDRRCIFYNRRMMGRYDFEDFAYDRITSVQVRKGLAWGAIDIYVAQVKKELYMTNNDCAEALGNFIREKIHYRTPLVESPAPQPQVDMPTQLRELAQLLKEGHLTQQEYDDLKRELLSKFR